MTTTDFLNATASPLAPDASAHYAITHGLSRRSRYRLPRQIVLRLAAHLDEANGTRRTRTMGVGSIQLAIAKVIDADGVNAFAHLHAGHVANSYGSAAFATVALIVRVGDVVAIRIRVGRASKGCTGFGKLADYMKQTPHGDSRRSEAMRSADLILRLTRPDKRD